MTSEGEGEGGGGGDDVYKKRSVRCGVNGIGNLPLRCWQPTVRSSNVLGSAAPTLSSVTHATLWVLCLKATTGEVARKTA